MTVPKIRRYGTTACRVDGCVILRVGTEYIQRTALAKLWLNFGWQQRLVAGRIGAAGLPLIQATGHARTID